MFLLSSKSSLISPNKLFKIFEWILLCILFLISILCTWGVIEKFNSKTTSIGQKEKPITKRPTITFCFSDAKIWTYGTDFNISYYKRDGQDGDLDPLDMGENYHEFTKEHVYLEGLHTIYFGICYKISASFNDTALQNVYTPIKIKANKELPVLNIYITSEENSYGITTSIWMDGEVMKIDLPPMMYRTIDIKVLKQVYLETGTHPCGNNAFYECFGTIIAKSNFSECPKFCLPISILTLTGSISENDFPICNYGNWSHEEYQCPQKITETLLNNIISNQEQCTRSCSTYQYSGKTTYEKEKRYDNKTALLEYKFSSPSFMMVHEEYLVFDALGMISSVGGTLGLFIGFSFSNVLSMLMGQLKILTRKFHIHVK